MKYILTVMALISHVALCNAQGFPMGAGNEVPNTTPSAADTIGTAIEGQTPTVSGFIPNTNIEYDFEVDGIYYYISSFEDLHCTACYFKQPCPDTIVIPSYVEFKGRKIKVTDLDFYHNRGSVFYSVVPAISIILPPSIERIPDNAFDGSSLMGIYIPDGIVEIGNYAFSGCRDLKEIYLPNSVTKIGYDAFERCTNLKEINLPNSVTEIGSGAFRSCTNLEKISIPNSVTEIGRGAFDDCTNLEKVVLPNKLTEIRSSLFRRCSSLREVTIPDGVSIIWHSAFYNCIRLEKIIIPHSVALIGHYAFSKCANLNTVIASHNVSYIGEGAFEYCDNLRSVIFDSLGIYEKYCQPFDYSFFNDRDLSYSYCPIENKRMNSAFIGCKKLTKYEVGPNIAGFTSNSFSSCNNLDTLIIRYDKRTDFDSCRIVPSMTPPVALPMKTLYLERPIDCSQEVFCPETLVYEDNFVDHQLYIFTGINTDNLVSITYGGDITHLPGVTSKNLRHVYVRDKNHLTPESEFSKEAYLHATLYVPKGMLEWYKTAPIWNKFWTIEEYEPNTTGIENVKTTMQNKPANIYSVDGTKIVKMQPGINIIREGGETKKVLKR